MIETPAAVSDQWRTGKRSRFLQYRNERSAAAYTWMIENPKTDKYYNPYHPALMKMIRIVANNVHLEGKRISICGDWQQTEHDRILRTDWN